LIQFWKLILLVLSSQNQGNNFDILSLSFPISPSSFHQIGKAAGIPCILVGTNKGVFPPPPGVETYRRVLTSINVLEGGIGENLGTPEGAIEFLLGCDHNLRFKSRATREKLIGALVTTFPFVPAKTRV
jgi:hypothetical protein